MKRLVTAAEMKAVEDASAGMGVRAAELMENAGQKLADVALSLASPTGQFVVIAGTGNNGGDGLVAARRLVALGRAVKLEIFGDSAKLKDDPSRNLKALLACGVRPGPLAPEFSLSKGDVVVDALFGTGLSRAPDGQFGIAIRRIQAFRDQGAQVVAVDVPSGLESDSGKVHPLAVTADATVSFGLAKLGQVQEPGASLGGVLHVVDIGLPLKAVEGLPGPGAFLVEEADARRRLPKRAAQLHKGSAGHVLVVAGSWGKTGAAALTSKGVLRAGAGLCTLATRPEVIVPAMAHAPELMGLELVNDGPLSFADFTPIHDACDGKAALVVGPGIPRGDETVRLLGALFEELTVPCVVDADALNAVAGDLTVLSRAKSPLVLTPHPGELARLLGITVPEVQSARVGRAREFARKHKVTLVLKGAKTVIAQPDGTVFVNPTGNPGMASAGMGDVLAGIIGGLLAQGLSASDAAVVGVYAHGLAGDLAVSRTGQLGLMASDVLEALPSVWARWER